MSAIMKQKSYLDYNATCPIRSSVIEKTTSVMTEVGNPSSVHEAGRKARSHVEEARSKVAALVGARPRDVLFCAGGTEANNTVLQGAGAASLIISSIEHDSVLAAAKNTGLEIFSINTTDQGIIDVAHLKELLLKAPKPALVSIMFANNETGAIQPISDIAALVTEHGARLHTDAIQAAGKISIDQKSLSADYITLSSHKIGGPQGVGAIILTPTAPLKPLIVGGGQELGRRSGTENVAGIAGFGVAAFDALVSLASMNELAAMRDRLETEISATAGKDSLVAASTERLANTSCLLLPGIKGETQVMHFDLAGVSVSSGSACSSGKVKVSHVLTAMGYETEIAESSIRISLGYKTTETDIDQFLAAWHVLHERTSRQKEG